MSKLNLKPLHSAPKGDERALLWDECEWLLSATTLCDVIEPLAARNYSIASAADSVWPRKLELCVGRQQWKQQHLAPGPRDLSDVSVAKGGKPRRRSVIGGATVDGALLGEGNTLRPAARRLKLVAAAAKTGAEPQAVGEPVRFTPRQDLWAREGSAEKWLEERSAYYFAESLLQDVRLEEVPGATFTFYLDETEPLNSDEPTMSPNPEVVCCYFDAAVGGEVS